MTKPTPIFFRYDSRKEAGYIDIIDQELLARLEQGEHFIFRVGRHYNGEIKSYSLSPTSNSPSEVESIIAPKRYALDRNYPDVLNTTEEATNDSTDASSRGSS